MLTPEQWHRVKEVFAEALERDSSQRAAFLDEVCDGDDALRGEVDSLINAHEQEKDFMSVPAIAAAAPLLLDQQTKLLTKEEPRFPAGKQLGNYELLEFVESGGMGEIYKARNVTLSKVVALKFLPTELAQDAQRLRRLRLEARAASALNHPNIVTVHDFVEAEHSHFIVSEYVEGETLRQRLKRGRMGIREAIDVATQIATGLAAAHKVGVIHRDIKPENIMLRPDGYVKILDFGLAKLNERSGTNLSQESQLKTEPGGVIGTPRYMSPEQVRGLALDARTDVWSLGVVIYEMLSGGAPFEGQTNSDVLAAILEREPAPLVSLASDVPTKLQRIVAKALRKDREERYQVVNDMLLDLKSPSKERDHESLLRKINRHKIAAAVLVAGVVLAVAGVSWRYWPRRDPPPTLLPMKVAPLTSYLGFETSPAFSPDGNFVAFCWGGEKDDNADVYVLRIGSTDPPFRVTNDPAADINPVWSPDGTQIAFARVKSDTENALYVKSWLGGPEKKIYTPTIKESWGGEKNLDWSPDGKFIAGGARFLPDGPYQVILISLETLKYRQLTFAPENSFGDLNPQFSPDGQSVSFSRCSGGGTLTADFYIVPVGGGEPRRLTFDNVHIENSAWTADGREIVFASNRSGMLSLWRIAASGGTPSQLPVGELGASTPSISRQGNRLAFDKKILDTNMYRLSLDRSSRNESTRIASSTLLDWSPNISGDGKRIAFESERSGQHEIWTCNSDGSDLSQLTFRGTYSGSPRWSPDGQQVAFDSREKGSATANIYVISAQGGSPRLLTAADDYEDVVPSWSKDGQWIYFTSKRSGDWQVWKMPATGGDPVQVTKQGGFTCYEAPDGKAIYYGKGQTTPGIWRVPVDGGDEVPVLELTKVAGFWGNWAVAGEGIYYILYKTPDPKSGAAIYFFSFATQKISTVASLGKVNVSWVGFAVSPDGKLAVYTLVDQEGSDIMLVENFH